MGGKEGRISHAFFRSHIKSPYDNMTQQTSIGMNLPELVQPVLTCFEDPDARVRYYACESLYNISKVARGAVLVFFNDIFNGLCKVSECMRILATVRCTCIINYKYAQGPLNLLRLTLIMMCIIDYHIAGNIGRN